MKKYTYVLSDIHGDLKALESLVDVAKIDLFNDKIIILGDVIDRGPYSLETIHYIMEYPGFELIRGNHEEMFLKWWYKNQDDYEFEKKWSLWGGRDTILKLKEMDDNNIKKVAEYILKAPYYIELDFKINGNPVLLTHTGFRFDDIVRTETGMIDCKASIEKGVNCEDIFSFMNSFDYVALPESVIGGCLSHYMISGHVPCQWISHSGEGCVIKTKERLFIDCGCQCEENGKLAAYRLEDGKCFYKSATH